MLDGNQQKRITTGKPWRTMRRRHPAYFCCKTCGVMVVLLSPEDDNIGYLCFFYPFALNYFAIKSTGIFSIMGKSINNRSFLLFFVKIKRDFPK